MSGFYVYRHTCVTGEEYVGITKNDPRTRWKNGTGYANNRKFSAAIRKYGWEAFIHEVLAEGLSKEEAEQMEAKLIEEDDTISSGYNNRAGGAYPQRGKLTGQAAEVLWGLGRVMHQGYINELGAWYQLFKTANMENDTAADNLNRLTPAIVQQNLGGWFRPNDPEFLARFLVALSEAVKKSEVLYA